LLKRFDALAAELARLRGAEPPFKA